MQNISQDLVIRLLPLKPTTVQQNLLGRSVSSDRTTFSEVGMDLICQGSVFCISLSSDTLWTLTIYQIELVRLFPPTFHILRETISYPGKRNFFTAKEPDISKAES
ncbi:hypothetical protein NC653_021530 [Populus alba x Populus x berolinensis]|uniref:Uncharacterized protein n=1 Tax=Populus alba x Populus x berolinensis TaxID=444605 RepID=A0AAD6MQ97_9ROSI|nr:hypothetical protein NC653_021530 [Populus alba x Populus x berolinensis]